jgi:heptosyltransferase-2
MQKILIIQTAFIGDVILATPLIDSLHVQFPNSKIDFLVKNGNQNLLINHPNLNRVLVFDKSKKIKSLLALLKEIRKEKYDLVVNLQRFFSSGLLTAFSCAKEKRGFKKNPLSFLFTKSFDHIVNNGLHEVERNLALIEDLCKKTFKSPKLYPSAIDFDKISTFQSKSYYCIAPSSVWFTKQAPKSVWIKTIHSIKDKNAIIYLIGGSEDFNLCEEISIEIKNIEIKNLAGKLSLMESAALIKGAIRTFVNDSGPLHLASAMNAPVTVYFCSTSPSFGFGPLSDDSEIIEVKNLSCKPCGLHGYKSCPKGHFECGDLLLED